MANQTPKRSFVIADDLWNALTEQAWKLRMNTSELLRKLIVDFLTEKNALPKGTTELKRGPK